jgi:hypothetical protein
VSRSEQSASRGQDAVRPGRSAGLGQPRRRSRRGAAAGTVSNLVLGAPRRYRGSAQDEDRARLERQNHLGAGRSGRDWSRLAVAGLLGRLHERTDLAEIVRDERQPRSLGERHRLGVAGEHASPADGLDHIQVTARGEEPREQSEDEGDALPHPSGKNKARKAGKRIPFRSGTRSQRATLH